VLRNESAGLTDLQKHFPGLTGSYKISHPSIHNRLPGIPSFHFPPECSDGAGPRHKTSVPALLPPLSAASSIVLSGRLIFFSTRRISSTYAIKLANAVDLAALSAGKAYYTETATLQEALDKNNAENAGNFIAWGMVIAQDREKQ
jgi:hypothetical protein